ncbi:MAG: GIY-YIG nuclease family protein [Alphaproteobacteria bacterium]|nr:GIY-YIG nuclease family protein [Alphaproteobacteria bacterium]MDA8030542.1 GIY-YIG nuclease family protein [Alphaproteobacteria bacterium]
MTELVYILTNPTIPDLVKIGRTTNLEERVRSLSSHSGVPVPFECYYCCEVKDSQEVERRLSIGFGDHRINPKREFYRINPERVKAILEGWAIGDEVTLDGVADSPEEQKSLDRERSRRPAFTFSMIGLERGAVLTFLGDETLTATVAGEKTVDFEGERDVSFFHVTLKILRERFGKDWPSVRPSNHWEYEGKTLTDRRLEMEEAE